MANENVTPDSSRTPTVLCFDVEDLIAPESDDAALWLAEILSEYELTGSFMVVGEKARLWEKRGRRDVIEALKRHHLSFHSTWHSVHPTTTEICLDKDFAEGMDALWDWDRAGWEDTQRILGRPLHGWARTGSSWSPSVMGLMGRMGRAYAYSVVRLPGHNVCWYAGCLGFYGEGLGGFDETFCNDSLFLPKLERVKHEVDAFRAADRRGASWLCFFMCHPTRVISTMFWDAVNFAKGANPPREVWKPAPCYDPALVSTMQANYRRLCDYLRGDERLEIVGWGELIQRYDGQRAFATHQELVQIARRIADERKVVFTDYFTAAEILIMLLRAASGPQERYARPAVYGPRDMPPAVPLNDVPATLVTSAARQALEAARSGYLPAAVTVGEQSVGIGTYFVALAEAIAGRSRVSGPANVPYPAVADEIAAHAAKSISGWVIHPEKMDLTRLLEQTRLQCWTLKPAWPRESLAE